MAPRAIRADSVRILRAPSVGAPRKIHHMILFAHWRITAVAGAGLRQGNQQAHGPVISVPSHAATRQHHGNRQEDFIGHSRFRVATVRGLTRTGLAVNALFYLKPWPARVWLPAAGADGVSDGVVCALPAARPACIGARRSLDRLRGEICFGFSRPSSAAFSTAGALLTVLRPHILASLGSTHGGIAHAGCGRSVSRAAGRVQADAGLFAA